MKTWLPQTDVGVKYFLIALFLLAGEFSIGFHVQIAPQVWDDFMIFFFMPFIPLLLSLILCREIILEESLKHRMIGICLLFLNILLLVWAWNETRYIARELLRLILEDLTNYIK